METQSCAVCATLSGKITPPGGILYSSSSWAFYLHAEPLLVPGQGFAVLTRHCESLDELSFDELVTLGPFLSVVTWALSQGLGAERVHLGLYGEDIRHAHFHVLPRLAGMPRGNIPLTLRSAWVRLLRRARLSRSFDPALVEGVAGRLKGVFERASGDLSHPPSGELYRRPSLPGTALQKAGRETAKDFIPPFPPREGGQGG